MYSNIGHKLRTVAKVIGMIGLFIMLTGAILILISNSEYFDVILGCRCLIIGLLLYISTFPMYAFGQLVDDVRQIKDSMNSETIDNSVDENAN